MEKSQLEICCDKKLLKYLDEPFYIDFMIDQFPRHILIAKLWQQERLNNYDAVKTLLKLKTIQDYLQIKFTSIKKLSVVGILSGNQNFDENVNYHKVFINTVITNNLKQFKLLLTLYNIDPSIKDNIALCEALINNDIAHNPKLKKISNEMIKLLVNNPKVIAEESIVNFIMKDIHSMNYIMKHQTSIQPVQYICSKILIANAKEDINIIIDKCMSRLYDMTYTEMISRNVIMRPMHQDVRIEKLLYVVCNNSNVNLEQFVDHIIKNPNIDIYTVFHDVLKNNDLTLIDVLLTKIDIKNINTWTKIIKCVIFYGNVKLTDFLSKYPLFPLHDITFCLLKNCPRNIIKIWFNETKIDFIILLQDNINTKNLENIKLLLGRLEDDKILGIKNIICSISDVNLLSSIFSIGIKNESFMFLELMLDNIFFDPFFHPVYYNYHLIELLNVKKLKFKKLVEYFWTRIILLLDIFVIKDIRQHIFNMTIMTNHIIFTIL